MSKSKRTVEGRMRETKVRLVAMDWLDHGSVETLREARRILDSLDDSEIQFEYEGLPRIIRVRPWLDRYDAQIKKERKS